MGTGGDYFPVGCSVSGRVSSSVSGGTEWIRLFLTCQGLGEGTYRRMDLAGAWVCPGLGREVGLEGASGSLCLRRCDSRSL